jgi:hypothetical protein
MRDFTTGFFFQNLNVLFTQLSDWAASLETGIKFHEIYFGHYMQIDSVVYPLSCLRDAEAMRPERETVRQNSCNIFNYFQ